MSSKTFITVPDAALQKLRCALCADYLSHFPVYSSKGIGTVCGRCPVLLEEYPIHNEVYEIIAETLSFPCRYNYFGCVELLTPKDIVEHEDTCIFRQYFCPFMPSGCCPWQGPSSELMEHFHEKHNIFILEDQVFEIDFTTKYSENYLLARDQNIFVIHKKSDIYENLFWCTVSYVGSKNVSKQYSFQLVLSVKGNENNSYTFPAAPVHCFINPNIDNNIAVEIDASVIKNELDNPANVICSIIIQKIPLKTETTQIENISERRLVSVESIEEDILNDLECPICMEFMVPPIFQCETGHSVCSSCKSQISECPTCKQCFKETRNFHLEKITNRIKYYCKYRDYDCIFIASSKDIKQHEAECKFGPYKCPLHDYNFCSWKGKLGDIMQHVHHSHDDNVLELDTVNVPYDETDFENSDEDCFIIQMSGELFKLVYKYEENNFYWSVQLIGPASESKNFMFILDIIDNSNKNQRFFIKRPCAPLLLNSEAFKEGWSYVKVPLDLISSMIDKDLTYRVQIVSS